MSYLFRYFYPPKWILHKYIVINKTYVGICFQDTLYQTMLVASLTLQKSTLDLYIEVRDSKYNEL